MSKTRTPNKDLDLITLDDGDLESARVETLTVDLYGNDTLEAEDTLDIIMITDDDATADIVYGSSNSCVEPVYIRSAGNDTLEGVEEGTLDIVASADDPDLDGLDVLDLSIGEDRDAHAAYGGSNSCEPYAGENTCEPPEGGSSGGRGLLDLFITSYDIHGSPEDRVDTLDIITSAAPEKDDDDLLELTIGEDKDAHAAYGGSNSCDPYAGENTCEPPVDDTAVPTESLTMNYAEVEVWE